MTPRQIGQLVLISALWGAVFLLIKYALEDFSVVEVAFSQAAIGAIGLLALVLVEGGRARGALSDIVRRPAPALLLGALAIAAPFLFISLGELVVPAGLAGVLVSSTPMFVALFAPRFDRSAEINRIQVAGLVVGLLGVALVVGVQSVSSLGQSLERWRSSPRRPAGPCPASSSNCSTGTRACRRARRASSRSASGPS